MQGCIEICDVQTHVRTFRTLKYKYEKLNNTLGVGLIVNYSVYRVHLI